MELRQLRYLVTLADEQHFTRAAALLHIAQPALSQQIRRLEDELGIALVDRTTRHVSLTAAGERLVARARRALAEVEAATAELSELSGIRTGRVVIGAMRSTGPFDLSALLAAFHALHPGVELVVREEPSELMLQHLHADRSEEHTSELQSPDHLVCRLLLEKKKKTLIRSHHKKKNMTNSYN